jgi:hypothetical protein
MWTLTLTRDVVLFPDMRDRQYIDLLRTRQTAQYETNTPLELMAINGLYSDLVVLQRNRSLLSFWLALKASGLDPLLHPMSCRRLYP